VERSLWTDERLDDMVDRIEKRFDEVDMLNVFLVLTVALVGLAGTLVAHSL
jgi:hypothetical protein